MKRLVPLALYAAAVAGLAVGCTNRRAAPPPDPGPPTVTVAHPLSRPVTQFTDLTGTLAPEKTVDLRAQVPGRIVAVEFREGGEVREGDVLVRIDPRPFEADLLRAEGGLAKSQSALTRAQANLDPAERENRRLQNLSGASPQEKEAALARFQSAQADVKTAEADVKTAEGALAQARLNLEYATVKAPFAGRIDRIYADVGNVAVANQTVLSRLVTIDPMYAYFDVDEERVLEYIRRIAQGKIRSARDEPIPCEVQLKGERGYPHKGVLPFVGVQLNPATGTLQVRGTFPNPPLNEPRGALGGGVAQAAGPSTSRALSPGFFVRGRIPLAADVPAILIPDAAVTTDQAKKVVYAIGRNDQGQEVVQARPVVLGPLADGLRVVVEGLTADDRIVLRGLLRLQPGTVVVTQPGEIAPAPAGGDRTPPNPAPAGK